MKAIGGFYWPDRDEDAHGVILRDAEPAVAWALFHTPGRKRIVQAGGNVGVYPRALAKHFEQVETLEPDDDNLECLLANLAGPTNIRVTHGALGAELGWCRVEQTPKNCGAHQTRLGDETPVYTIDHIGADWDACDAIWLDVEGCELPALKGAIDTIMKFSPAIVVEEKGLGEHYGIAGDALPTFLRGLGYREVARQANDRIYKRETI